MDSIASNKKIKKQTLESLVKSHTILVKRIAQHLSLRLPKTVHLDDLIQAGMVGLLEAVNHYDARKGASFETYAGIRIRGHMLDEVRKNDWVPRSVYRQARMISEAVRAVENKLGRDAKDTEVAEELGVDIQAYHDMLQNSTSGHMFGFEELGVTEDVIYDHHNKATLEPLQTTLNLDFKQHLNTAIDALPSKEKLVLILYYEQDLNLKEIGEVLDVSESRVSQIHTQAIVRIKARMSE